MAASTRSDHARVSPESRIRHRPETYSECGCRRACRTASPADGRPAAGRLRVESNRRSDRRRRAEGQPRDLLSRREVAIHQRRRNRQRARDIVESTAHIIGRQQRRHVRFQVQQVAHGILVFSAIQTMKRFRAAGFGFLRRRDRSHVPARRQARRSLLCPGAACPLAASALRAA